MKLKQLPDDFQVEELTDVTPSTGEFAFYRLTKAGWTTPDAVAAVCRRLGLDPARVAYGGLKDRHARTVQYLTVYRGPRRGAHLQNIELDFLGQVPEEYRSRDIRANRFRIVLRSLTPARVPHVEGAIAEVRTEGFPNYFDDQRFGSAGAGEFAARAMVQGRFEDALKLALTAPYEHDRAGQKKEKALLRAGWGNWSALRTRLGPGAARRLIDFLVHRPGDFRGALERLRPELRSLYLSAYQSHLWNRMLARWLRERLRPNQTVLVSLRLGEVPMHRGPDAALLSEMDELYLPLPGARTRLDPDDPRRRVVDAVLAEEGLTLETMKVRGSRNLFFSRGERAALCRPTLVRHEIADDELNPGRRKLIVAFELPRGSYATLMVKRITCG